MPCTSNSLRQLWTSSCQSPANNDSSILDKCQTQGRPTSLQGQLKPPSWNLCASFPGSFSATHQGPASTVCLWYPPIPKPHPSPSFWNSFRYSTSSCLQLPTWAFSPLRGLSNKIGRFHYTLAGTQEDKNGCWNTSEDLGLGLTSITSTALYWSKQIARPAQIQGRWNRF